MHLRRDEMLVAFRCDASLNIGGGHVARCLTLAQALVGQGAAVLFICRDTPPDMAERIRATPGVEFWPLPTTQDSVESDHGQQLSHRHWLPVSQAQDAKETASALETLGRPDWLVVDHYALDVRWERQIRQSVSKIFVIDDLADRQHLCDMLLDQNFVASMNQRYAKCVEPSCNVMTGPRYALLRSEFVEARSALRQRNGALRRLLVFFGSYDPANFTLEALYGIGDAALPGVLVDVVLSAGSPHRAAIEDYCHDRLGFKVHIQTSNMAGLMACADLAIGASGATTWERCCLGLPSIAFAIAENQVPIAAGCESFGASIDAGQASDVTRQLISDHLRRLAANPKMLTRMSVAGLEMVDALGVQRVCNAMYSGNANLNSVL